MIDTRRWVLVETWLSLGLRVEWAASHETQGIPASDWMQDEETRARYYYDGYERWLVARDDHNRSARYLPALTVPEFSLDTMKHELAHYLVSTTEERRARNFGIQSDVDQERNEERTQAAEKVIDALVGASGRIATLALLGESTRKRR